MISSIQPNVSPNSASSAKFGGGYQQRSYAPSGTFSPQDFYVQSAPPEPKKSGFFNKLLKGTALVGAAILGGIAFKRYAPGTAAKVSSYIPELVKKPADYIANTGVSQKIGELGNSALTHSEGLYAKAKDFALNLIGKGVKPAI